MSVSSDNKYIKKVCEIANINEIVDGGITIGNRKVQGKYPKYKLITSHIGRRSFASNFYGKIPTPLLMACTGHSTEKMFLTYIGKADDSRSIELAQYFKKIKNYGKSIISYANCGTISKSNYRYCK